MFNVNKISSYRDVIAISDSELIGKKFEQDNFQLDVKENFYKGEEVDEEELVKKMNFFSGEDSTFNIVGEKSIKVALKAGIISEESVKKIQGIPYSMVLV